MSHHALSMLPHYLRKFTKFKFVVKLQNKIKNIVTTSYRLLNIHVVACILRDVSGGVCTVMNSVLAFAKWNLLRQQQQQIYFQ